MKKDDVCRQTGFTLIEIVIIVGVLGLVLMSVMTILANIFKAENSVDINSRLTQRGNFIIDKIRDNLLEANPNTMVCGLSISYITKKGKPNVLSCGGTNSEQIASNSGNLVGLVGLDNILVDCGNFSSCEFFPDSTKVSVVNVGFSLSMTDDAGVSISRSFETKVMIRD